MRTSTTVILKQLDNEGVVHDESFGLHWLRTKRNDRANYLGADSSFPEAVEDALSHSIRITALLSKLKDSLGTESLTQRNLDYADALKPEGNHGERHPIS